MGSVPDAKIPQNSVERGFQTIKEPLCVKDRRESLPLFGVSYRLILCYYHSVLVHYFTKFLSVLFVGIHNTHLGMEAPVYSP